MSVESIIQRRGISEVLHFTTNLGLAGVLATHALKCKNQLRADQYLAHIVKINTQKEFDPEWNDHVHLSISRINAWLYGISSGAWHPDLRWRILSFDPIILTHSGVHFVTTNNAYRWHLSRGQSPEDLEALFADEVAGRYGVTQKRGMKMPPQYTTCEQAELLYPGSVSTDFLRLIYVKTPDDQAEVSGQLYATGLRRIEVVVEPDKFVGFVSE